MTKRRKILLACFSVLIFGGVIWMILFPKPDPEPSYNGKTLSEWVMESDTPDSAAALQHFGTNAIPYLLKWVDYESRHWKKKLRGYLYYYLRIELSVEQDEKRLNRAIKSAEAFQHLGKDANIAIPHLRKQVLGRKQGNDLAILALAHMGQSGLPTLMEAMTNQEPKTRENAAWTLRIMGTNAQPAFPLLVNMLDDTNSRISSKAAMVLGNMGAFPDDALPSLTNKLAMINDIQVKMCVVRVLGGYGEKARPIVPMLLPMLSDPDSDLQWFASNALRKIDPEALNRAMHK